MDRRSCRAVLVIVLLMLTGCDRGRPIASALPDPGSGRPVLKVFTVKGVVRKVDAGSGSVTISHEEIPGFMAKMTMPFTVKDKAVLDDVQPGDEVEGPLEVTFDGERVQDLRLVDLTVVRPRASVIRSTLASGRSSLDHAQDRRAGSRLCDDKLRRVERFDFPS